MSAIHTKRGSPRRLFVVFVTLLMAIGYTLVTVAPAAGVAAVAGDEASYRTALGALSANPNGPHTLELAGDIDLTGSGHPTYSGDQDLTIIGNGFTIDANAAGTSTQRRGLYVTSPEDVTVTLQNVTVREGRGLPGGGVFAVRVEPSATGADLVAVDAAFVKNQAIGDGAGITTSGDVTLLRTTVADNFASDDNGGVGGYNITIVDSTISGNVANDEGGGVFAVGDIELINSTVTDNWAKGSRLGGGGIHARGIVTLIGST
ncbi:MAG: hypothetical protein HKN91_13625, partial [Acidimicrobiia bacterium]|nr:hypothetical protein [Acidimicrobiia bacterium]